MAGRRASSRLMFFLLLLPFTTGSGLKFTFNGRSHVCVSSSQGIPISLGNNPAQQCGLVNTTPAQASDRSRPASYGETVNEQQTPKQGTCTRGKQQSNVHTCRGNCKVNIKQPNNKKHFIIHNPEHDKSLHVVISNDVNPNIVLTGNTEIDKKVGYGMLLMSTGNLDQAIEQFTNVIKEHPWVTAAYYGRGTAYVQKGMKSKENAEAAIQDFSSIIRLSPDNPDGWVKRAEVFSPLGQITKALSDIKVALDLKPSIQLHLMFGSLHFMKENYEAAAESFLKCLEMERNQSVALLYYGLSLYHRGRVRVINALQGSEVGCNFVKKLKMEKKEVPTILQEAIENFKRVLQLKANLAETHGSMGHAYRELGNAELSYQHFTSAINLEPNVAQNYQARGILSYMRGRPDLAVEDFKVCLSIRPDSVSCQYWSGVSHAARGNFYEAVKSSTKILLTNAPPLQNIDLVKSHYIKEYSRYLHWHLDTPLTEFSPDVDLDGRLRDHWVKSLPFNVKNYNEQPGIQPQIREVEIDSFADLTPEAQVLLCESSTLGPLVQYNSDGFLPSIRHQRAMGLAMLDVSQVAQRYWKGGRSLKVSNKRFTWREAFDVAVKWRRISEPDQPVFWLDMMPEKSVKSGFNVRINLLRGQLQSVRYSGYFDKIFQFTKAMLQHLYKVNESATKEFRRKVDETKTCRELMDVLKTRLQKSSARNDIVNPRIKYKRGRGQTFGWLEPQSDRKDCFAFKQLLFILGYFHNFFDVINAPKFKHCGSNLLFTMDTPTTPTRTAAYHAELDHIWANLNEEIRKPGNKDVDAMASHILSLVYYFFNLMPLSRGSSAVAYTVALGLFLAVGRDVTGKIPPGKEVDMEAMIGGSVETFTKHVKGWLGLKKLVKPVTSLPLVSETFPTLRTVIEALNVQFTDAHCRDVKPT